MLKGGLAITVLKGLNQAGIRTPGLGLYAPSAFAIPTSSSQYLRSGGPTGGGSLQAGVVVPIAAAGGGQQAGRLGYHRFRSRYAGGYG